MLRKLGNKINGSLKTLGRKGYNNYKLGNRLFGKVLNSYATGSKYADKALNFLDETGMVNTAGMREKKKLLDGYEQQARGYRRQANNEIEKQRKQVQDNKGGINYNYLGQEGIRRGLQLYNKFK